MSGGSRAGLPTTSASSKSWPVACKVSFGLHDWLEARAGNLGITRSELVRDILEWAAFVCEGNLTETSPERIREVTSGQSLVPCHSCPYFNLGDSEGSSLEANRRRGCDVDE